MASFEHRYSVRLTFEPGVRDPSRLFFAFGNTIESLRKIDTLISNTMGARIRVVQTMESLELGSIFTRLKESIEYDDELESDPPEPEAANRYLELGKKEMIRSIRDQGEISDIEQIRAISKGLKQVADETGVSKRFNYSPPPDTHVAEVAEEVVRAAESLEGSEETSYVTESHAEEPLPRHGTVEIERIEASRVDRTLVNERRMILKIKKPDFLGQSKWELKHGRHTIPARIDDEDWLSQFHGKNAIVSPGDSLDVEVRVAEEYDRNGNLLKEEYTILNVYDIIPGELDLDEE